ncbi:MAG: bifunctional YncE family protein/alkaline phosphatase family protein [Flavisolibacter sp.]|nr:bifunctional YncE family protein/alkaline phosphatase family protein [Flavisolibacter sp.]
MKRLLYVLLLYSSCCFSQTLSQLEKQRVHLPNGWSLTPVGNSLPLGDLPLNIAVSPNKKLIAITNNGQSVQSIQLFDAQKEKQLDSVVVAKSWYGLAFGSDNQTLYASGGNDNWILKYIITNNKLQLRDSIKLGNKWPEKISPAGIAVDDEKQVMYVVTKEDNSLYIINLRTKEISGRYELGGEGYNCLLSATKKQLFISCWGCDKVLVFDTEKKVFGKGIPVGDNPNEMLLTKNNRFLFVCNANDNSVSVIDVRNGKVMETLNTALYPDAPSGSTTNGLALSEDEKTLYVANADNNCLAVFDVSSPGNSRSKGFIPVGWYPTNIKVIGKKIWVTNGKGFSSMANPYGPNPVSPEQTVVRHEGDVNRPAGVQYIAGLFKGTLSIFPPPNDQQLGIYTKAVYANTPYTKQKETIAEGEQNNPIPITTKQKSPIKYVFYVIKENRTYDQVLGDLRQGNGDTSLVLFGNNITPNQHALATQFVLLDNFYVNAEVSADGHNWSTGAYATDYLEKTWPAHYSQRGGTYDGEGKREIANNKAGFIWDHCRKYGVSYRTYGEFADDFKPNIPSIKGHFCPYFISYNTSIKDTTRFYQWKRDFDSLLAINAVPQLNTIRFGNDHTDGLRKGRPTPFAHVADNDLAVGLFIEHLSKSPIWKESAVFILEDDAQNGADHVDAHRSTAYLAGGLVKRNFVDHTMYTTASMLRTIELILGLPPMTQFDAAAVPMWRCFQPSADTTPFIALASNVDLNEKNTAMNEWQRRSEAFNLAKEDANPDLEFNLVLWHAVKGDSIPFPGPRRAAFVQIREEEKDDD